MRVLHTALAIHTLPFNFTESAGLEQMQTPHITNMARVLNAGKELDKVGQTSYTNLNEKVF